MKTEVPRQLVHLSGIIFAVLAQFTGGLIISFYCLFIALTFLVYSWYVRGMERRMERIAHRLESRVRGFVEKFEKRETPRPFMGAFWFYFAFGLAFLVFPLGVASAACIILAVGDALSTLAGKAWGRHRIRGKSLEGSLVFLVSSLLAAWLFVGPVIGLAGALAGMVVEMLAGFGPGGLMERGLWDDNLLIPLASGLVMWALAMI